MKKELIVAIDGPSGAGKSTLSKRLAGELGYINIDTGAMYRAFALAARNEGVDPADEAGLALLCPQVLIEFSREDGQEKVFLNGEDVTTKIRTPEISLLTSRIAACPAVRHTMVDLQRRMGAKGGVVLEGRDIGTVVFPKAEVKFFLVATPEERGRRRYEELKAKGLEVGLDQTIAEVEKRDADDSSRAEGPLLQADDAIPIDTTRMTIDEVLAEMLRVVQRVLAAEREAEI
ncbi:(d)CMP kinase [Desulfuromonas sp. AOP6]|uniref:(d)CMP kinase n=1 Tax=Desulfuromonas sp. AOP6 TaxID=1566351 RepID=UPI0012726282|nr:(d)CMP kinase [Desulfuromonas sp. AOP6]BCA79634.1 cytidylate kinase [Desulfuromonas sp. AOP6]